MITEIIKNRTTVTNSTNKYRKYKDNLYLTINNNRIITNYKFKDLLNKFSWHISDSGYARSIVIYNDKRIYIYLHKLVMDYYGKMIVDHINNNKFDNRIENLRIVSAQENAINRVPIGKIKYKGVTKHGNKFRARIFNPHKNKRINLGTFSCPKKAAKIYDKYAKIYYGKHAYLNETRL